MRTLGLVVLALLVATAAKADVTRLDASVGWNDLVRPGHWHPAVAMIDSDTLQAVVLEWYVPQTGRQAMVLRQPATLNPGRQTFLATLPVDIDPWAIHLRVADAETGATLGHWPRTPRAPADEAALIVADAEPLVVVAGGSVDAEATRIPPRLLPTAAVAYEAVDALVLADFRPRDIAPEAQAAIAEWVRDGGLLHLWLDDGSAPQSGPIVTLLPGVPTQRVADADGTGRWLLDGVDPANDSTSADVGQGVVVFHHVRPTTLPAIPLADRTHADAVEPPVAGRTFVALIALGLVLGPAEWLMLRLSPSRRRGRSWWTLPGWALLIGGVVGTFVMTPNEPAISEVDWWRVSGEPGSEDGPIVDHVVTLTPTGISIGRGE